jgi:hypothetical protein
MKTRLFFVIAVASACSSRNDVSTDTASYPIAAVASSPALPDSTRPAVNPCAHTGLWAACSLERRLKQSGFVVKKLDEAPTRAGFSMKPVVYSLGASRLEVFFYDDEKTASKELMTLDTIAVAPKGSQAGWPLTPVFIRSANLAAVLLTENQRQAERVVLAITAGPPQPGSPR